MDLSNLFQEFENSSKLGIKIYPILFQDENYYVWMSPSQFLNEMRMSTEDRIEKMRNVMKNKPFGPRKLKISPEMIIFQNYAAEVTQTVSFSIMNATQKMMNLKVCFEKTEVFQLQPERNLIQLAPGIKTALNILFTPLNYKDYLHKIILETSREFFTIPILCIGPRPLLDLPDNIILPNTPVKRKSSVVFNITNIGVISTIISLKSTTYFSISPQKYFLPPGEKVEVKVSFKANYPGNIEEDLLITLESGENLISKLCCRSLVVDVILDRHLIDFTKTYIDMTYDEEVTIINKSQYPLHISWMKDKSNSSLPLKSKKAKCILAGDDGKDKNAATDPFIYSNNYFVVDPVSEEIPPLSEKSIIVKFSTKTVGKFQSTAFCDVSGSVDRLPLIMMATCLGPNILLDPTHMAVDLMFSKQYKFSVAFSNQGEIDGEVVFKKLGSNFGTRITCEPSQFVVKPDEKVTVSLSLTAYNPGPYIDDAFFEIQKSFELLKLTLKGKVSSPRIRIEPAMLSFGEVPIGFKITKNISLKNLSDVAFDMILKISTDGSNECCVDVEEIENITGDMVASNDLKEFTILPQCFTLYPAEIKEVTVQLLPGIQRHHETLLELTLHQSESNPLTVPLQYTAISPNVISSMPNISLKNCYIKGQIICTVKLCNISNIKGYFYSPKEPESCSDIECNILPKEGVFNANQQFCLDLFLKCNILGKAHKTIRIHILGAPNPMTICELEMFGVGPTIVCTPKALNWGELSLLHQSSKTLTLRNESPIDTEFTCHFKNPLSVWDMNIKHAILKAEDSVTLTLTVLLKDIDNYRDKLIIEISNSKTVVVPLTAKGINSCIVMEPATGPLMDFGKHFTFKRNTSTITLKNYGTKTHHIKWSNVNELLRKKEHITRQCFHFSPQELKLGSMESKSVEIEYYNNEETSIEEHWYMFGVVEYGRRELLKEVDLRASFVTPSIEKSKENILFEINRGYIEQQFFVLDYIFLKNTSPLDVKLSVSTNAPFQLVCEKSLQSNSDPHMCAKLLTDIIGKSLPKLSHSNQINIEKAVSCVERNPTDLSEILCKFGEIFSLVQCSTFTIEQGRSVCVNVLFNENILQEQYKKNRLVKDALNIFLEEDTCKDSVSLIGEVNVPDVELSPSHMILECKPYRTYTMNFKIKNTTSLTAKYELLFHKFTEKISVKKSVSVKQKKKSHHVGNECHRLVREILDKCVSKSLYSLQMKNYSEMENILLTIVGLLPNTEEDECDGSYRKMFDLNSKRKYVNELIRKTFIENIIFNSFLNSCNDVNAVTIATSSKVNKEKHGDIERSLDGVISFNRQEGELPPFSSHEITVLFKPLNPVDLSVKVLCFVECGHPRYLNIRAISGDVQFSLDKDIIDFGICLYYTTYTETIVINNSGCVSFEFTVSHPDEAEIYSINPWQAKILEVSPNFGKLSAGQSITLFVKLYPGIFGKFEKCIKFNLADYQPIEIPIVGIGTFPQIDVDTDYSYNNEVAPSLQYNSISNITKEWLSLNKIKDNKKPTKNIHVQHFTCKHCNVKDNMCCHGESVNSDKQVSSSAELSQNVLGDDWIIVTNDAKDKNICPTLSDIKFTVERTLILERVSSLNTHESISNVHTFKRFLDFGFVTYNQTIKRKVELISYYICDVNLKILNKRSLPPWIKVLIPKTLNKDSTLKNLIATVDFSCSETTVKSCKEFICCIYVQVVNGAIIPIEAKATLAIPTLHIKTTSIDFGSVYCGNIKVSSLPIINGGVIPCNWTATILNKSCGTGPSKGFFPFQIFNQSGRLQTNEHDFIKLSFRPMKQETSLYFLRISMEHNPNNIEIDLIGNGLCLEFEINGSNISFQTALPLAAPEELSLTITNPNVFPIHLQFCDAKRNQNLKGLHHILESVEEHGKVHEIRNSSLVYTKFDSKLWEKCENIETNEYGTCIICHQVSPSDTFHIVRKIRNDMNLPLVSVDNILLSCIASQDTESSTSIRRAISQTYMEVSNETHGKSYENETDRLEIEINKIYSHFCETATNTTAANKMCSSRKPKIKLNVMSDNVSSSSSCSLNSEKIFNVPESQVLDVLKHSLSKYKDGCIINDLSCMFVESQTKMLKFILKSLPPSTFVHFVLICDKGDTSNFNVKARKEVLQKTCKKLLHIVENWDPTNKCLTTTRSKSKEKKQTSNPKRIFKKSCLQKVESEKSLLLESNQAIGLPSWIFTVNNMSVVNHLTNNIKIQMDKLRFKSIAEKDCTFGSYSMKIEKNKFNFSDEPFKIQSVTDILNTCEVVHVKPVMENAQEIGSHQTDPSNPNMLPPKSLWNLKFVFEPKSVGSYLKSFHIIAPGSNEVKNVCLIGICDMPRFIDDPYLLFSKVIESSANSVSYPAFEITRNLFNFGTLFSKLPKESPPVKGVFTFKNVTSMDLVITLTFLQPRSCFSLSLDYFAVQPNESESVTIAARPTVSGTIKNTLICCVANNPSPYLINLIGQAVTPSFNISQSSLEFGKLLLYRRENRCIFFSNMCELPLQWRVRNISDFDGNLFTSKESSTLNGKSSEEIKFYYDGNKPMLLDNAPLHIDVYEKPASRNEEPRFILTKTLKVSLECYDVLFDCKFSPEEENHINFGKIIIGSSKTRKIFFTNKGTYGLIYKIQKSDSSKVKMCIDDITVRPATGLLKPSNSPTCIEIIWKATYELKLSECSVISCHLVDVSDRQKTVAVFPLNVSVQCLFTR